MDEGSRGEYQPDPSEEAHMAQPYRLHMQTMLFRSRRMRTLYPLTMDPTTQSVIEAAVHNGSLSDVIDTVEHRSAEVARTIENLKAKSSSSGSSGSSRSSFGGGRSSGGRGGRW